MQPLTPAGIAGLGVAVHVGVGPTVAVGAALRDGGGVVGCVVAGRVVAGAAVGGTGLGVRGVAVATGVVVALATTSVDAGAAVLVSVADAWAGRGCASALREPHATSVSVRTAQSDFRQRIAW